MDPKSRTQKKTEEAREELQNPDMAKFDRAMHVMLKIGKPITGHKKSRDGKR